MKTEQEKIEEIATEMCGISKNNNCGNCVVNSPCIYLQGAKKLYSAGYCNASEVIDEFESRLSKSLACQTDKFGLADLKYVVAEMRQEVEKWEKK